MAQANGTKLGAEDLHPEDLDAIKTQFVRIVAGIAETATVLRAVEEELNRLREQPENVVPIARRSLEAARKEYRGILAKASGIASSLGVVLPVERMTAPSTEGDDVGAIPSGPPGSPQQKINEAARSIMTGGITPAGSFITVGEGLAAKAISKLGATRAVAAAGAFARFSGAAARRAAVLLIRAGGKWLTPAMKRAVFVAAGWYLAAGAIRVAAPGIGAGLGNLISTPGGLILGGFALYILLKGWK